MNAALHVSKSKRSADVYVSLKGTKCPQKCVIGIFISSCL